jgi:adenylate kinase family enzyme
MNIKSRFNVIGTSGSGKSTLSRKLANLLNIPYVEMDSLFWKPNWQESSDDEFFAKLESALENESWVLDGNYPRTESIKWSRVGVVIWLDYSFTRTLYQSFKRAIKRIIEKKEIWPGTSNVETFRKTFCSKKSIILWTLQTYHKNRKRNLALFASHDYPDIEFVRLRSPKQVRKYLEPLS